MILVFDLDDTLYDESTFVKSGFRAVASYLSETYSLPANETLAFMLKELESTGRGRIFDNLLLAFGKYNKRAVQKCLSVYRTHRPDIKLSPDAMECIERFVSLPIYIVTDGNKIVQMNKLKALGLDNKVKFSFITHHFGIIHAKPSPYCFLKICQRERVKPEEVIYVADNPNKDFVGIKPLGFQTIRVLKGHYKNTILPTEFEADYLILDLNALTFDLLNKISGENL